MVNILLVEDDIVISDSLKYYLEKEGYSVEISKSISDSMQKISNKKFDLALLDITLDDGSGYDLIKEIKSRNDIPVIFLTALDDEINVVQGFELGADDYITKPFRAYEFLLRIKAVLRRYNNINEEIVINNIKINLNQAKIYKDGKVVELTASEYKLLLILVENRGRVLSREKILANIWDVSEDYVNDNTLTVYIKRLREKIEDDPADPKIIKTVRGLGYKVGE